MKKNILIAAALLCLAVVTSGQAVAANIVEADVCFHAASTPQGHIREDAVYTCAAGGIKTIKELYSDGFRIITVTQPDDGTLITIFIERSE